MTARRLAAGCGTIIVILLLLAGCGLAKLSEELPAGQYPDVDFESAEIDAARDAVVPKLEAQLAGMKRRFEAERVGDSTRIDFCEQGFDNFEGETQYAYMCRMALVELIPVREPFDHEASRLGEALLEGDCPDGTDTDRALAEPHDHPRQLDTSTGDCTPGYRDPAPEIRGWLAARPSEQDIELAEIPFRARCRTYGYEYARCDLGALRRAAAAAPDDAEWLALVAAEETYYLVAWECDWPASWFKDLCQHESGPVVR
jgi:hypothetical protein